MKKIFAFGILAFVLTLAVAIPLAGSAQTSTLPAIYQQLVTGQVKCSDLKDSDFYTIGDYILNAAPQAERVSLNAYINQYKGTLSDKDFTTLMGKYFTGCEVPGTLPGTGSNSAAAKAISNGLYNGYLGGYWKILSGIGMIFGIVSFIIFVVVLIVIIKVIMHFAGGKKQTSNTGSAADILKERYAKGEMTKEEYEEKKKDISK